MDTLETKAEIKATILIVDDSPDNRLLLSSQLNIPNYTLLEAGDGRTGLQMARDHHPDLILLDVMMPIINGFEVCKTLKSDPATATIPIIIVTALRDVEYRLRGIEVGADEFLSRPHHREELLVRVRSLVRLKQTQDRLQEKRDHLQLLYNVTHLTADPQQTLEERLTRITTHVQEVTRATQGCFILLNPQGEMVRGLLIRPQAPLMMGDTTSPDFLEQGLVGWMIHHQQGEMIRDIEAEERAVILLGDETPVGSAVGVPLLYREQLMGLLILTHTDTDYFHLEHLQLLEAIATQMALSIEWANHMDDAHGR